MGNVELFLKIIEQGYNQGNLAVADAICAPTLMEHGYVVPTNISGAEILKTQIRQARSEVVDLHIAIEDLVVSGEKVWARSRAFGKSRSGKELTFAVFDVCRFKGGKLVEHWGVADWIEHSHKLEEPSPKTQHA